MSPIKEFTLTYEAPNAEDTFTAGDTLSGTLDFTLTKATKVKRLFVKVKGDARVQWTKTFGNETRTYSAHRRYFKLKESLVEEGTVLPQGFHQFKFRFNIPEGEMPSSFTGSNGCITYTLEAKLSRSWRWPTSAQRDLSFFSKPLLLPEQVMCPQHGSVNKEVGVFSKKQVQISATINRKVCSPGDTLSIVAQIHNSSSKEMTPKFNLQQMTVYSTSDSSKSSDKSLCKMLGNPIKANSEETVCCQMMIPGDAIPSLQNCEIVSVEYYLKVYLDISFATDPEVLFPLIVVPSSFVNLLLGEPEGPYAAGASGGQSYSNFSPPAFPVEPYHVPVGSGAHGYQASHPTQHVNIAGGYNDQWPQQAAP